MIETKKLTDQKPEINFADSLTSESLDIIPDIIEALFDSTLNEGLIKEIPILSSLIKLIQAGATMRDKLLAKKILTFLKELKKTTKKERVKFAQKLNENLEFKHKIGERLLLILDRLDEIEKATIIGKIFTYHIQEKIDYKITTRLVAIVDRLIISDLTHLTDRVLNPKTIYTYGKDIEARLSNAGLMNVTGLQGSGNLSHYNNFFEYSINSDGELLAKIISNLEVNKII